MANTKAFLLLFCIFGCDPGPGDSVGGPVGASGSRLKLQFMEGADGSRLPQGLWDSERNEACEPVPAEDGFTRCIPKSSAAVKGYSVFADSACSRPAAGPKNVPTCPQAVRYLLEEIAPNGCDVATRQRVFRVLSGPGAFYRKNGDACESVPDGSAYAVEQVPASAFVALTRKAL